MIDKICILHKSYGSYLACCFCKESASLLGIIAYHHQCVVQLCEYGLDTLSEQINSTNELLKTVFIRIS